MRPWQYYPDAEDVYPGAETTVQDEDTQPLEKPIIAPVRTKNFDHVEKKAPVNPYSMTYLHQLLGNPALVRNIVLAGHLHHGKSSFMDCLVRGARPAARRQTAACPPTRSPSPSHPSGERLGSARRGTAPAAARP